MLQELPYNSPTTARPTAPIPAAASNGFDVGATPESDVSEDGDAEALFASLPNPSVPVAAAALTEVRAAESEDLCSPVAVAISLDSDAIHSLTCDRAE